MTPAPPSAALLREGSGPRESLSERIRDTPPGSRGSRRQLGARVSDTPPPGGHARARGALAASRLRPTGFPRRRPGRERCLARGAARWSRAALQRSQVPALRPETAGVKEAVCASVRAGHAGQLRLSARQDG